MPCYALCIWEVLELSMRCGIVRLNHKILFIYLSQLAVMQWSAVWWREEKGSLEGPLYDKYTVYERQEHSAMMMMMSERKVISLMDVQMAYNAAHFASFYVNHSCSTQQQWNGGKQHLMTIFIEYNNLVKESSDEEKILN